MLCSIDAFAVHAVDWIELFEFEGITSRMNRAEEQDGKKNKNHSDTE